MRRVSANAEEAGPQDRPRVGEVHPEWFLIAERFPAPFGEHERQLAHTYSGRILRWGNLLALKLGNGKFDWLVDMQGASGFGCCEIYQLDDFSADQGLYIVGVSFGEHSRWWLVSARSAEVTVLIGPPHRDPMTPNLLVAAMARDLTGYRVEVWEYEGGAWQRGYKCDELAYATEFIRWQAPGVAILGGYDRAGNIHGHRLSKSAMAH